MSAANTGSRSVDRDADARPRVQPTPTFRDAFDTHAPYVWRALRRLGVADADVHDVCQEVFVVVHRRLADFDGSSAFRTWIYGICLRTASQYRRRAHHWREELSDAPPEMPVAPGQEDAVDRRRARDYLDVALAGLSEEKREVFVLYELEDLPMSEVARAMGCPLQTAYSRLHSARSAVEHAFRGFSSRSLSKPRNVP